MRTVFFYKVVFSNTFLIFPMKLFRKIVVFLILSFSIWQDYRLLFQSKAAASIDAYYYVLQITWFNKFGHFYFSITTPFVLYFLSALAFFTDDPIFAVKFGAVILQVLLYLGISALLQSITKNAWFAVLGIFLTAFSVLHLYFLSEFLNNLGALVCLIWGAFGIVKTIQTKKKIWLGFAGLTLLAAILSHRSAVWIIALAFLVVLLAHLWLKYATSPKRAFIFDLLILVLFFLPLILAWQSFFALPEWFSAELSKHLQNPFHSLVLMESLTLLVIIGATLSILYLKPKLLRESLSGLILASIVVWSFLLTLNPFLNHQKGIFGIVVRLDTLAFLQTAIAVPLLLFLLFSYSKKFAFAIASLLLPLLFLRWFSPFPVGLRTEYLQAREKLIRELPLMRSQICEKPFIIAQHGEQFLVTAILQVPSQQKPPIETEYQCVYWLVHQDDNFVLIEDSELRKTFEQLSVEEIQNQITTNPHLRELLESRQKTPR